MLTSDRQDNDRGKQTNGKTEHCPESKQASWQASHQAGGTTEEVGLSINTALTSIKLERALQCDLAEVGCLIGVPWDSLIRHKPARGRRGPSTTRKVPKRGNFHKRARLFYKRAKTS